MNIYESIKKNSLTEATGYAEFKSRVLSVYRKLAKISTPVSVFDIWDELRNGKGSEKNDPFFPGNEEDDNFYEDYDIIRKILKDKNLKEYEEPSLQDENVLVGLRKKQLINNIEDLVYAYNNGITDGFSEPFKSQDELIDYVYSQLFDQKSDGEGTTQLGKGVCRDLKYLGKDYIVKEILRIGKEVGVLQEAVASSPFLEVSRKSVSDSDGFSTDYVLYHDTANDKYVTVFGDQDIYKPEDGEYDAEFDSETEAKEWFDNYEGFNESEEVDWKVFDNYYNKSALPVPGEAQLYGADLSDLCDYVEKQQGLHNKREALNYIYEKKLPKSYFPKEYFTETETPKLNKYYISTKCADCGVGSECKVELKPKDAQSLVDRISQGERVSPYSIQSCFGYHVFIVCPCDACNSEETYIDEISGLVDDVRGFYTEADSSKKKESKYSLIVTSDKSDLKELYNSSALTFEGLSIEKDNLDFLFNWLTELGCIKEGKLLPIYNIKGKTMNQVYGLTGDNAYPDDSNIVSINLNDLTNTNGPLVFKRFQYGGRWFDDVVDNNAQREGRRGDENYYESEEPIEFKETPRSVESLKSLLQNLADRDFYHEMKDGWTHEDFDFSDRLHKQIKRVIDQLEEQGVKAEYRLGYPIKYSEIKKEFEEPTEDDYAEEEFTEFMNRAKNATTLTEKVNWLVEARISEHLGYEYTESTIEYMADIIYNNDLTSDERLQTSVDNIKEELRHAIINRGFQIN